MARLFGQLTKNSLVRKSLNYIWGDRGAAIISGIQPFLGKNDRILDIGAGSCHIPKALIDQGYKVTAVDIEDLSIFDDIKPLIYNGKTLPFKDNEFDVALILDVLHHVPDPISVLKEAKRVARKIVVMEGIYRNQVQKHLTFIMDSATNMEFFGHPHNNKEDQTWKEIFKDLGLEVKTSQYHEFWRHFEAATYVLERKSN